MQFLHNYLLGMSEGMDILMAQGKVTSNFALTHFNAAKHFSDKCNEIQNANIGQPLSKFFEEISFYCSGSIVSASASLEALINELFIYPGPLREASLDFETFFWGNNECRGLERDPVLKKYKKAVNILGKDPLSRNDTQYQKAESLIGFRNYLIHFKPLWDEDQNDDDFEQRLTGCFITSPFVDEGANFFAMKCMSSGCASWAVQTVVDFVSYFSMRTSLSPKKLNAFR